MRKSGLTFSAHTGALLFGLFSMSFGLKVAAAQTSAARCLSQNLLRDAYAAHDQRVRQALPAHSALPPVLTFDETVIDRMQNDTKWEKEWKNTLIGGTLNDPGAKTAADATSIATTFVDGGGHVYALPAQFCGLVVVAENLSMHAHIDYSGSFVYSKAKLKISSILKEAGSIRNKGNDNLSAIQFGGGVRFPSGHIETFILAGYGFFEPGKRYIVFAWKPKSHADVYIVAEAYLISGDQVFPINSVADARRYEGMPLKEFEAKVKSAIARNVDTD